MQSPPMMKRHRFVDAHVHLRSVTGLAAAAAAGIYALRDAGMKENAEKGIRKQAPVDVPAVVASGWAIYKKGGYGAQFGRAVETRDEMKKEISNLKQAGADIIKVIASGLVSLKQPGTVTAGGFDRDELSCMVEEAGTLGLGVMAHANGESAIIAAASAGVRSIEHGFFMTERALEVLAGSRIYWTPTTSALVRAAGSRNGTEEGRVFAEDLVRQHLVLIRKAHLIGVPLAVGTDCVLPCSDYDVEYARELKYFEQSGIDSDSVMRIAGAGGMQLLGIATEMQGARGK